MLAVFAEFGRDILRERVRAGINQAREKGGRHGRPRTAAKYEAEVRKLFKQGLSKAEISRRLGIGRTSVIRILGGDGLNTPGAGPKASPGPFLRYSREAWC